MNWNKDKSIRLSQVCVAVFALVLLALDVFCYPLARWYLGNPRLEITITVVTVYLGSVFVWIVLADLWRLLGNLRQGLVFVQANVRLLRRVSWCCVGAALVCLVSNLVLCLCWWPWLKAHLSPARVTGLLLNARMFLAVAAGFMALIVRIVKNVFQQAVAMKDELDLTI